MQHMDDARYRDVLLYAVPCARKQSTNRLSLEVSIVALDAIGISAREEK